MSDFHDQPQELQNFEIAFRAGSSGCRRTCHCGREFYDGSGASYSWDDGELEALRKDSSKTPCDYCPGDIRFEGNEYVDACDCWHERAKKLIAFITSHGHGIAEFLKLEKARKQAEADNSPTV